LAALAAPMASAAPPHLESPALSAAPCGSFISRTPLLDEAPRHLSAGSWSGGTYPTPDGERVTVYISKVYIAPLPQVAEMCFTTEALGCYGGQTLVVVGESTDGIAPSSIATHEYGHHVAANRSSAPWPATDWGTKRWASQVGVCSRVVSGMAFPGDEGVDYSLNPGEAFAESYRVLVETNGTAAGYDWPIVDPSFRPTPESLAAIREDVLHPWVGPTTKTIRGKFLRQRRTWSTQLATFLDGDLRLRITVPGGGADDVTLLSGDGRTVLATGSWTSSGGKSAEYQVCGARSVRVRVTRAARLRGSPSRCRRPRRRRAAGLRQRPAAFAVDA
jgi:hypothetical protein